jgi:hypothetical protein
LAICQQRQTLGTNSPEHCLHSFIRTFVNLVHVKNLRQMKVGRRIYTEYSINHFGLTEKSGFVDLWAEGEDFRQKRRGQMDRTAIFRAKMPKSRDKNRHFLKIKISRKII